MMYVALAYLVINYSSVSMETSGTTDRMLVDMSASWLFSEESAWLQWYSSLILIYTANMMTWSNGNVFHVTSSLWRKSTGYWWIPLTKASGVELWCFLWSAPEQRVGANNWGTGDWRHHHTHYDVTVMKKSCLWCLNIKYSNFSEVIGKKRKQRISLDILRPGQNGHHYADYIFKCIFVKENFCNLFEILLKVVPWCPSDNDLTVCGCQPDKPMASLVATSRITPQCLWLLCCLWLLMCTILFCCIPLGIKSLLRQLLGHLQTTETHFFKSSYSIYFWRHFADQTILLKMAWEIMQIISVRKLIIAL